MEQQGSVTESVADRFARWCEGVVARLPWGLHRYVPATFLGFALINSFTFAVDLLLLTLLHGGFGLPVWLAVTLAYIVAFGLSFWLNRTFNFHSHAPMGRQAAVYVCVVAVNYLAFILGVSSVLTAFGVDYHLARVLAGGCEAVYMYCAMRWVVFRVRPVAASVPAEPLAGSAADVSRRSGPRSRIGPGSA
ncbi:GtrA family protein [Nocardia halotolerans]|uniref:GtrA family protein n=1 Tax=Nocardia halotolerans TaxID=1755878 RepID=A0ABV8VQD0_9NOCA